MEQSLFQELTAKYCSNHKITQELWNEIENSYSNTNRHYHTLLHLEKLHNELLIVKDKIDDWNTILFTLYYHDIVYNPLKSDNEEKSAKLAEKRMHQLGVNKSIISKCFDQIIATKSHQFSKNSDTNYFTDADLSILGSNWESYQLYFQNVRKEYSIYPTFLYNRGRKKVLNHFLNMDRIYKTDHFYEKLEEAAKQNLENELELLS